MTNQRAIDRAVAKISVVAESVDIPPVQRGILAQALKDLIEASTPEPTARIERRVFRGNGPDCLGCGKTIPEHLTNYKFCPGLPEDDKPLCGNCIGFDQRGAILCLQVRGHNGQCDLIREERERVSGNRGAGT